MFRSPHLLMLSPIERRVILSEIRDRHKPPHDLKFGVKIARVMVCEPRFVQTHLNDPPMTLYF